MIGGSARLRQTTTASTPPASSTSTGCRDKPAASMAAVEGELYFAAMISAVRSLRQAASRSGEGALDLARKVLTIEADAVRALTARLDGRFLAALQLIQKCLDGQRGRVIVSGIGKSGHV